jgi:Zn-finger nucleic acid-binding protein
MICPNDSAEMHQVKIESHYGQPIFIEQCDACGGIWFDESELYRVKQGEAEKIEALDTDILWAQAAIQNETHICPKDRTKLIRFNDEYFPKGIVVERCRRCDGFWLNRGEFTKYQKAREKLLQPKEKTAEDTKLEEHIKQILEANRAGNSNDSLKRLGQFLSTPIDKDTLLPAATTVQSPGAEKINLVISVLATILRLFLFK